MVSFERMCAVNRRALKGSSLGTKVEEGSSSSSETSAPPSEVGGVEVSRLCRLLRAAGALLAFFGAMF